MQQRKKYLRQVFLRNHKYTEEGGVIPEEYRIEYLFDKNKNIWQRHNGYYYRTHNARS